MRIRDIGVMIPEQSLDNVKQAAGFGENKKSLEKKIGALKLPTLDPALEPSDMAVAAINAACKSSGVSTSSIQALVVVTQTGDRKEPIPHVSAIVHTKLGLNSSAVAFDVGLGCSGYVFGLQVIQGLMSQLGLNRGVLVTADPYSRIVDRNDKSSLLFGDAATATVIDNQGTWEIGPALLETDGAKSANIQTVNGVFEMNGRQVFNFAINSVPRQIRQLLKQCNLCPEEVDLYFLHQGSAAIVHAIASKFPEVSERFPCDIKFTGNTVSSSIPLMLKTRLFDPGSNCVLLSGFGVGLSWGSTILRRVDPS
jgi:3-oxoacyl-[acyl-carrier-protein] synthase III